MLSQHPKTLATVKIINFSDAIRVMVNMDKSDCNISRYLLYFFEIPPPQNVATYFSQLTHPNKCRPWNLTIWLKGQQRYTHMHMHYTCIQVLKLHMHVRDELCRHHSRNLATLKLLLQQTGPWIRSCHGEISRKYMYVASLHIQIPEMLTSVMTMHDLSDRQV